MVLVTAFLVSFEVAFGVPYSRFAFKLYLKALLKIT
jgi:hypothetical protein